MIRSELSLAGLAALNIAATVLNQLLVFMLIGPGSSTDALVASATLPALISAVWAAVIPAMLVPRWAGEAAQKQADEALPAMIAIGAATLLVVLLFVVPGRWWIDLLFRGFSGEVAETCVRLFRIQMTAAIITPVWTVVVAVASARGRFIVVESLTLAASVIALVALYWLLPAYGVDAAAWLNLGRAVCLLLICLPLLGRWPRWPAAPGVIGRSLAGMGPMIAANAYYKAEFLVDRHLLSMAPAGSLSLYGMAQLAHGAASSVLGKVWGTTAVTQLASAAKSGNRSAFMALYWRNLSRLVAIAAGGVLLIGVIGPLLLGSFGGFGQIDNQDARQLWLILLLLGGMLVGGAAGVLLAGAFYAVGDTATPTWLSIVTFTIFIVAKYQAFLSFGVTGLCLATSAYYLVNGVLLMALFLRKGRLRISHG